MKRLLNNWRRSRLASIVCLGAILAFFLLNGATTDVGVVSPAGATNITRSVITNNVGSGKLLAVSGTNIFGIPTNSFVGTNILSGTNVWTGSNRFDGDFSFSSVGRGLALTLYQLVVTNTVNADVLYGNAILATNFLRLNGVNVLTNIPANGTNSTLVIWITTNSQGSIANGIGMLTNNGSGGFGYTTNISQDITINTLTTLISYISNLFVINGKNNTLVVTQALTLQSLGTNKLLRMGADGVVTNITNGAGVLTNDGSGGFSWTTNVGSGGGGGSSFPTNITTLTYTGVTNIIGFDCSTNGARYRLTLTTNAYIGGGNVTGLQTTNANYSYILDVINDTTGLYTLTFDPTIFAWSEGSMPIKSTNASGYDTFYFHTHGFTNSMVIGNMNQLIR